MGTHHSITHPSLCSSPVLGNLLSPALSLSFLLHQVLLCLKLLPSPSASFSQGLALCYGLCESSFSSELSQDISQAHFPRSNGVQGFLPLEWLGEESSQCAMGGKGENTGGKTFKLISKCYLAT